MYRDVSVSATASFFSSGPYSCGNSVILIELSPLYGDDSTIEGLKPLADDCPFELAISDRDLADSLVIFTKSLCNNRGLVLTFDTPLANV